MKTRDVLAYLKKCNTQGASFDGFKKEFPDIELDDIKRVIHSLMDMGDVKSDGKGRGLRYYLSEVEVIKITINTPKENVNRKSIQGIDLSGCVTFKNKIDKIIDSDIPLTDIVSFEYKENLLDQNCGRELRDFIHNGAKYIDIKIHHNSKKKKNEIFYTKVREIGNTLSIKYKEGEWQIIKTDHACPERPEIVNFKNYFEFEKCLKTLFLK